MVIVLFFEDVLSNFFKPLIVTEFPPRNRLIVSSLSKVSLNISPSRVKSSIISDAEERREVSTKKLIVGAAVFRG